MRKLLIASLLTPALGIPAALANQQANEMTERWLFLGRRAESGWQPPAASLATPGYPAKAGNRVVVRRHALVYEAVDCKKVDLADFKVDESAPAAGVELVRAGEQGLEITGSPIECPSICGAKTVWVTVRIPAARLIRIDH